MKTNDTKYRGFRLALFYMACCLSVVGEDIQGVHVFGIQVSLFRIVFVLWVVFTLADCFNKKVMLDADGRFISHFMTFWLIWAVVSGMWAVDYSAWFRITTFIGIGVASMYAARRTILSASEVRNALAVMLIPMIAYSAVAWYEIATQTHVLGDVVRTEEMLYHNSFVPMATTGNPNGLAQMMLQGSAISLFLHFCLSSKPLRMAALLLSINFGAIVVRCGSRGISLSLVVFLLMFLAFKIASLDKKTRTGVLLIALPVVAIALAILISGVVEAGYSASDQESDLIRINLIKNGLVFLGDTFCMGVGSGQIESWMASPLAQYDTGLIVNMHNYWFEILTSYGVIVFFGYIVFYWKLFRKSAWIAINGLGEANGESDLNRQISVFLAAYMVCFVFAAMIASSLMRSEMMLLFWGLMIAWHGMMPEISDSKKTNSRLESSSERQG